MGEVGSGPRSTTTVKCPRPGHAGSKVKRDGSYGPDGHRRQRYRCVAGNGDAPHRFTEPHRWLDDMDALIQGQFARRGFAGARRANMPLTTGGLEQRLRPIRDAIHPRRYARPAPRHPTLHHRPARAPSLR